MDITVHHADLIDLGGGRAWALAVERDGVLGAHVFPEDTLEWRAAEYDIDPADTATLLDMVLYEALLHDPHPDEHPLATASTRRAAREQQLARLAAVRAAGRTRGRTGRSEHRAVDPARHRVVLDSGVEDPLAVIRRESPMSPEHIAVKAEAVARQRERAQARRAERAAAPARPARESADELRARLLPDPAGSRRP